MSRPLLFLVLGALCGAAALLVVEPDADALLQDDADRLQQEVTHLTTELMALAADHAQRIGAEGARTWMGNNAGALEAEGYRTGIIVQAFVGDSLIAWSGDPPQAPEGWSANSDAHLVMGGNILLHARVSVGRLSVHALRPIWSSPPILNRHLRESFHPSLDTSKGLRAETTAGIGPVIKDADGRAMFRLAWKDGAVELGSWLVWRALLLALSAVFIIIAIWIRCADLAHAGRSAGAIILFIAGVALLRTASLAWGYTAPFDRWPLFDPAIYAASGVFPSLGDLVINAILLVAICAFVRRALRGSHPRSGILHVITWSVVVLGFAAWVTELCSGLVKDSSIDLDLYHVQSIGAFSATALFAMALLMGAWCLLASAAIGCLFPAASLGKAILAALAVLVISIVVHHLFGILDTILFLWPVPGLLVLVAGRYRTFTFLHGVLVVASIAAASTHIITKYMLAREHRERVALAERMAAREDPVVELLFRQEAPSLRTDTAIYRLFSAPALCAPGQLEAVVRQPYFTGYWERYDIRLFGFAPNGDLRCASDPEPPRSLATDTAVFPTGVSDMPDLFINERAGGDIFYHAHLAVMPNDSAAPAQLIVELHPRSLSQGLGFPELLLAGDDATARRSGHYVQARYANGLLMDQSDRGTLTQRWTARMNEDGERWYTDHGIEYLAKVVGNNSIMVLGLPQRGLIDKATTFSYLFTFFGLLALISLAVHMVVARTVPDMGIGTKVRAALVLFAITGLLFFGVGSQRLLTRQFTQRTDAASLEKARSIQMELQRRLGDPRTIGDTYTAYLEHLLAQLGNAFLTDITVYAPDGHLLASSRPQMFTSGLLGPHMDPLAFDRIAIEGRSNFVHEERIGEAVYRSAYVPLLDRSGNLLAQIALPSFGDQDQQEEERSELLVAVVNLFVLLFVLSILLAVFISNWTTRPLDLLKRSLAGVALRGTNEPIRYRGRDEVGELVAVYNRKVDELRESAEKLARSERESAWKEMARQVAHEIKNPLTPMKLGIQLFQRSWDPAAPDAKEKLERFSTSMVEQIDVLNGVATAFSQFAQMPGASPALLDLSEVVRAAVDVFHATPGIAITHRESGPLPVFADREHMLRTINNLLKNAVQAIPEGREGVIAVSARSEAGMAVVEVSDNGTGIPEEARERIFTPSFTTKSSGMGLGLAMVKRMVEQAGGTVRFETRIGEGTTFIVSLPLHR